MTDVDRQRRIHVGSGERAQPQPRQDHPRHRNAEQQPGNHGDQDQRTVLDDGQRRDLAPRDAEGPQVRRLARPGDAGQQQRQHHGQGRVRDGDAHGEQEAVADGLDQRPFAKRRDALGLRIERCARVAGCDSLAQRIGR